MKSLSTAILINHHINLLLLRSSAWFHNKIFFLFSICKCIFLIAIVNDIATAREKNVKHAPFSLSFRAQILM